jgi:hypothetical protein
MALGSTQPLIEMSIRNLPGGDGWPALLNSVVVVRKRTIPTERTPLVGEVSANLCGYRDLWICSQKLLPLDHRGGHIYVFHNDEYQNPTLLPR